MKRQQKAHFESSVAMHCSIHPAETESESARAVTKARLLYAEDDEMLRELCRNVLTRAGYDVVSVANGVDAWLSIQRRDFDLIITDHEMPRCTGYELISKMRHGHIHWPVIVTTGHAQAFEGSASDWLDIAVIIAKPFSVRELISIVDRVVLGNSVFTEIHQTYAPEG